MSDPTVLCVSCRATFTEAETDGANACPKCGSRGLPGDLTKMSTLTLTNHEWRILFIWADQWASRIAATDREGYDSPATISAIAAEARRQAPTIPGLSLREDVRSTVDSLGVKAELHQGGEVETFDPPKKH